MEKLAKLSGNLPKKLFKILKNIPESVFLIDEGVASQIAAVVKKQNLDTRTPVLEINPGLGHLTKELKRSLNFENVTCFEEDGKSGEYLNNEFGVNVVPANFLTFSRLHHMDKLDAGTRVANYLGQINIHNINENKSRNLYVFGAISHLSFINFTIKTLVTQRVLYEDELKWQNPIYFVNLGAKAYWILTSTPSSGFFAYRPSAILFQSFFECELLLEVPRKAFIPWQKIQQKPSGKYKAKNKYNPEVMYLLKIQSKQNTVGTLGKEHLVPFWFFVRHHLFSRNRFVIAHLEQWVPGCGPRLIRQGFTIYTKFGELSPEQILNLYMKFISWPEFQSCSYLSAVEKFLARVDISDEEVFG